MTLINHRNNPTYAQRGHTDAESGFTYAESGSTYAQRAQRGRGDEQLRPPRTYIYTTD